MPLTDWVYQKVGVLPVRDHYYEPLVVPRRHLRHDLDDIRNLPGVDFNESGQLALLDCFHYQDELLALPRRQTGVARHFFYENGGFEAGSAGYYYSIIRQFRPARIVEIGSGNSTLLALKALEANRAMDPDYACSLCCVEPYESPWLENLGVEVIRQRVEELPLHLFETLKANDILFIDSSHIQRPQGDVLFEFLQILPRLRPGVLVHVHDIFTPQDYPAVWIKRLHRLWNEQYLLEAFLSHNTCFRIIGALNYLRLFHYDRLVAKLPPMAPEGSRRIGSFWFQRV